jgi:hypothetical protein
MALASLASVDSIRISTRNMLLILLTADHLEVIPISAYTPMCHLLILFNTTRMLRSVTLALVDHLIHRLHLRQ